MRGCVNVRFTGSLRSIAFQDLQRAEHTAIPKQLLHIKTAVVERLMQASDHLRSIAAPRSFICRIPGE